MEKWRQEFERVEEDGDDQGFEINSKMSIFYKIRQGTKAKLIPWDQQMFLNKV